MLRLLLIQFILANWSLALWGQSLDQRKAFIDSYVDQKQDNPGLYQSSPIYHIVPAANTITYGFQFQEFNLAINEDKSKAISAYEVNQVKVTGFSFEPLLALSLKNLSIGFTVERSKLEESYEASSSYTPYVQKQESNMESSGLGFNVAFIPFPKLHKQIKLALIANGKSRNIKHEVSVLKSGIEPVSISESERQSLRYGIYQYGVGMNLSWFVFKNFAIIPWADYARVDLGDVSRLISSERYLANKELIENDCRLFFDSYPAVRYGLDFAIQILGLDLRIGGLLGALANLNKSVDYIEDKSIMISASIEQKGH